MEEQLICICDCHSLKHQAIFWYNEEDKELSISIHLITYDNFFKRLWTGLKYAFGYTSNYGDWDTFIFKEKDKQKLRKYLGANISLIPYQKCPKCDGQGSVSKPPYVCGDVHEWTSSSISHVCDVCNGTKVIAMTVEFKDL